LAADTSVEECGVPCLFITFEEVNKAFICFARHVATNMLFDSFTTSQRQSVLCRDKHLAFAALLFLLELPRIAATSFLQRSNSHWGILGFLQRTGLIKTSGDNTLGLSRLRKIAARTLLLTRNGCGIVRLCGA